MFARGHCLLVGVPGLAKTLMIRTLADSLSLKFSRIQFTPDLMPADITGTEVIQEDKAIGHARVSSSCTGRSSPTSSWPTKSTARRPRRRRRCSRRCRSTRSRSAASGTGSSEPFFVLATQNPIEQEGTYPLPEAQLDRFMFNIFVDYPDEEEEFQIVKRTTADVDVQDHADADGRGDPGAAADRAQGAGGRSRHALRAAVHAADAAREGRRARLRPGLRQLGRRAAGQPVSWCWAPRPGPCCTAAITCSCEDIRAVA